MLRTLIACTLIFAFSAADASAQVLAQVGDKKITLKDFKTKYEQVQKQAVNPPSPELFLEDLIRMELGVQEAKKKKIENDPMVKESLDQVLYRSMVEKAIGKEVEKIKITEKEMRAYYKKNPEFRTSHILIEFKPEASQKEIKEAEKRAIEIYAEVKRSKRPFNELVKLYSDDTLSKQSGGDIGYHSKVTLVPPYYKAIRKMKKNQIKGLVKTRYGFHIIKLTGRRAYSQANKRQIRAGVYDSKRKGIFDRYFVKLKKNYPIKTNKALLKKIK